MSAEVTGSRVPFRKNIAKDGVAKQASARLGEQDCRKLHEAHSTNGQKEPENLALLFVSCLVI